MSSKNKCINAYSDNVTLPVIGKSHLLLLDILGYSRWMKNEKDLLVDKVILLKKLMATLNVLEKERSKNIPLYSHFYADNILLWTEDYSFQGVEYISFYGSFLISFLLHVGLPVRGAIASGDIYLSKEEMIFQGPPIIEAHEEGESQAWMGVVITKSTESELGANCLDSSEYIVKYDIPFKRNSVLRRCLGPEIKCCYTLDWPQINKKVPKWCIKHLCALEDINYLKNNAPRNAKKYYDRMCKFYNCRIMAN